jgi:hypothetical protein
MEQHITLSPDALAGEVVDTRGGRVRERGHDVRSKVWSMGGKPRAEGGESESRAQGGTLSTLERPCLRMRRGERGGVCLLWTAPKSKCPSTVATMHGAAWSKTMRAAWRVAISERRSARAWIWQGCFPRQP